MSQRILALTNALPFPPTSGLQMRDWEVLRALASAGCEINLLSFGPGEVTGASDEIRTVCKTVEVVPHPHISVSTTTDYLGRLRAVRSSLPYAVRRFESKLMQERISWWVDSGRVDVVLSHTPFPLVNLPTRMPMPLVINCHNVEHVIFERYLQYERSIIRRAYVRAEAKKLGRWERNVCSRAASLLVCSETDATLIRQLCPGPSVTVVPNVIDVNRYIPAPESDGCTVLYTGGMDWLPNRDAVKFFLQQIFPELRRLNSQAKFVVAGRPGPKDFHRKLANIPGSEFRGPITDMREELAGAAVCVVPLRIGSGTRFKILEAAAMAKPVVSTRVGAEGLDFCDGKEIVLEDQPASFARRIADLLISPDRRLAVGHAARLAVERNYSVRKLESTLASLQVCGDDRPKRNSLGLS